MHAANAEARSSEIVGSESGAGPAIAPQNSPRSKYKSVRSQRAHLVFGTVVPDRDDMRHLVADAVRRRETADEVEQRCLKVPGKNAIDRFLPGNSSQIRVAPVGVQCQALHVEAPRRVAYLISRDGAAPRQRQPVGRREVKIAAKYQTLLEIVWEDTFVSIIAVET